MDKWFKSSIGYQIYPRSFFDYNNDGIGDIKGIISKLDYLKKLGVNLLWICPFYKSPMDDNGYDISDYRDVDPIFGTIDDIKELISEAHKLDIKLIFDLVLNHTSDEHDWFQKAIKDPTSKYHDYYIFKKPRIINGKKCPPNNWKGFFSESAWSYVAEIDEYYLRIFSKKMPDLNWNNPLLRKEMYDIARYWLDMGCDGFRLDAIAHLAKDQTFKDSTLEVDSNGLAYDTDKFSNREEVFTYLKEFKEEVLDHYDCMTVGEVGGCASCEDGLRYANEKSGFFDMVFNFDTCWSNGAYGSIDKDDDEIVTDVCNLKENFNRWYNGFKGKGHQPIYWLNHDHPRVMSQYGDINYRNQSGSMLANTLLFLYGTPFIYQGEEIGMSNVDYQDLSDFKDVSAVNFANEFKDKYSMDRIIHTLQRISRMNARTPMQWSSDKYAGFSKVEPCAKVVSNYTSVNVEDELKQNDSCLNHYIKAIEVRKIYSKEASEGELTFIDINNPDVFAYQKKYSETIVVIGNFRNYEVDFKYKLDNFEILLHNYNDVLYQNDAIKLRPFESYVLKKL